MSAPPLLKRPTPAPYFHPLFLIFQIPPPSGGGNQHLLPPLKGGKGVGTMKKLHLRCLLRFYIRLWHKVGFLFGRNSESNYIEYGCREVFSRKAALEILYFLKYILEISYRNKDKITAKYRKGVILKTSKLRNDF